MERDVLKAAAQSSRRRVTPPGRKMWLRPWRVQLAPNTVMSDGGRGFSSSGMPILTKKLSCSGLMDIVLLWRRLTDQRCEQQSSSKLNAQGWLERTGSSFCTSPPGGEEGWISAAGKQQVMVQSTNRQQDLRANIGHLRSRFIWQEKDQGSWSGGIHQSCTNNTFRCRRTKKLFSWSNNLGMASLSVPVVFVHYSNVNGLSLREAPMM